MKKLNVRRMGAMFLAAMLMVALMAMPAFAAETQAASGTGTNFDSITTPIVELINSLLTPALAIVGAIGSLYCVVLGVKYAKAEEPQDREKAKGHLKSAIIGFVLIFVLMLALAGSMLFAGGGKEKAQEIYFLNFKPEIADVYEAKVIEFL